MTDFLIFSLYIFATVAALVIGLLIVLDGHESASGVKRDVHRPTEEA